MSLAIQPAVRRAPPGRKYNESQEQKILGIRLGASDLDRLERDAEAAIASGDVGTLDNIAYTLDQGAYDESDVDRANELHERVQAAIRSIERDGKSIPHPAARKVFETLPKMEREVAAVEARIEALEAALREVAQSIDAMGEEPGELRGLLRDLKRLRAGFVAALGERERLMGEVADEMDLLTQLDEAGVRDAAQDFRKVEELEQRLAADIGDPVGLIDIAIEEAEDMLAARGTVRDDF